ncbi:hypothetical protein Tco_0286637 [Tanacetum coccineum]
MVPYQSPPQNSQIVLANQLDNFKKTTEGSMQAMRNHITNLKAEIRSEVQATLQNQINSLKGEFKNELKTQHNLFVNQQNDIPMQFAKHVGGFLPKTKVRPFNFNLKLSSYMVPTTLPSYTFTNQGVKILSLPVAPKNIQPSVIQKSHDPVKPVSSPISPEPSSAQVNNSPSSNEPSKKTRLPYPSRVEREKKDSNDKVQIQKFWEMFIKGICDITLADALILMPKYQKMLKSLLTNKDKLIEIAKTPMNANCSAVILKKLPEKLGDPGRFLIPCGFGEFDKHLALADLGASINLMPLRTVCLIDVHGEELVIRDGLERIVFKPDGSQDNESIHMMDAYDDRSKMFVNLKVMMIPQHLLLLMSLNLASGDIIKQKEENLMGISTQLLEEELVLLI